MVEASKYVDSSYQMSPGGQKCPQFEVIIQITIRHAFTRPQQLASEQALGRHMLILVESCSK